MIEIQTSEALIPPGLVAQLEEKQLDQLAENLADAARSEWIRLGQKDQSSMRQDYIAGIQKPVVSRGTAVVALVGSVANMLEHGAPQQDLRDTLLGSQVPTVPRGQRGKHEGKEGQYYRAIPFRHATPGATGQVVGQEMGAAYSGHQAVADFKKLGREVYGAARGLEATKSRPGLGAQYGGRLEPGLAPKLKDHHKTDIYAGMIRKEKTYESATQGQYFTFRTISTKVTTGWIRGPIMARNYVEKVAAFVTKLAPAAVRALLEGA